MKKKLLVLMLVLGLVSAASATVITYQPSHNGSTADYEAVAGEVVYIDIDATGADHLMSTGALLVTITGDATITDLSSLTYAPSQGTWDVTMGLITNAELDDPQNARLRAATLMIQDMFWLLLPNSPVGNIGITYGGTGTATVTVVPNNEANTWGNTGYANGGQAGQDLDAAGGVFNIIPEPMTIALLGFGGLFLLRRRK